MRDTEGFTLIEVMIAVVILGIVMIGTQAFMTDRFLGDVTRQDLRAAAVQLTTDRIQEVQQDPAYTTLEARYSGIEDELVGHPGFVRETVVAHTRSQSGPDFKTITVTVNGPGIPRPVARTTVVAAP